MLIYVVRVLTAREKYCEAGLLDKKKDMFEISYIKKSTT